MIEHLKRLYLSNGAGESSGPAARRKGSASFPEGKTGKVALISKALLLLFLVTLHVAPAFGQEEAAIVLSREIIPYKEAAIGFKQTFTGFSFIELVLDEEMDPDQVLMELQKKPPALILAVGPEAAQLLNEGSVMSPRVFTMILNPQKLLPEPVPFPGVSMNYAPSTVLALTKQAFPDRKKIAIFFSPELSPLMEQYQAEARRIGVEIRPCSIISSGEVRASLNSPDFDPEVVLFIPDRVVIKEKLVTYIIEKCLFRKIPAVGFNTWFAKSGAILSLYLDYKEVGEQTATMATTFLKSENKAAWVEPPQKLRVMVNAKVAKKFGIAVSDQTIAGADQIIR